MKIFRFFRLWLNESLGKRLRSYIQAEESFFLVSLMNIVIKLGFNVNSRHHIHHNTMTRWRERIEWSLRRRGSC